MFFLLSKIFHFLVLPSFWIVLFAITFLVLKNIRIKKIVGLVALSLFIVCTNTFVFKEFVRLWEVQGTAIEQLEYHDVAIVLGGMAEYNNDLNRLSLRRGGDRIWQTLSLYNRGKIGKILISGDEGYVEGRNLNEAQRFRNELLAWGVPREDILIDSISKNTYQNAQETAKVLNKNDLSDASLLLVTSAVHMRRSQACFEKSGIMVTPFSTDHYTGPKRHYHWDEYFIPSLSTLLDWQALTHEWAGYVVYNLMAYI